MIVLQHLAHHAHFHRRHLYVAFLDISAAYDSADHQILVETMLSQEFPPHLVRGVAAMYVGLQYRVVVSGQLAEDAFNVGVGVKQGCPLSPMLYNLYAQPLSTDLQALGKGPEFPGVAGPQPDYHYADDIGFFFGG